MKQIVIVGTAHVFDLRNKIKRLIDERKPEAVCVELDQQRLDRLLGKGPSPPKDTRMMADFQRILAESYGTQPGNDMLGAVNGAKSTGANLYLIDQPLGKTIDKLRASVQPMLSDPGALMRQLLGAMSAFPQWAKMMPKMMRGGGMDGIIELVIDVFEKDPEAYRSMMGTMYPDVKTILLDEREEHMAAEIRKVLRKHDNVVVVCGLGHLSSLRQLLSDLPVECIGIAELRRMGSVRVPVD